MEKNFDYNKAWECLSDDIKKVISDIYLENSMRMNSEKIAEGTALKLAVENDLIERIFGKDNVSPKIITTWDDVVRYYPAFNRIIDENITITNGLFKPNFGSRLANSIIATAKINKLIELAYGGVPTPEDMDNGVAFTIVVNRVRNGNSLNIVTSYDSISPISFHSYELAANFLSYVENRDLILDYYMC